MADVEADTSSDPKAVVARSDAVAGTSTKSSSYNTSAFAGASPDAGALGSGFVANFEAVASSHSCTTVVDCGLVDRPLGYLRLRRIHLGRMD